MNIVVASDQNYVVHLKTLIASIGENNIDIERIDIHILDGGISVESKQSISNMQQRYTNMRFHYYPMDDNVLREKLGDITGDRSLSAFARILIPEIISADKAFYFDVDAVVLSDLREFYGIDLEDYAIAGVMDANPISRHISVGLKVNDVYINTGVILWNLEKCRSICFSELCRKFIADHNYNVDAMDQGTINGVLGALGLIKIIHPKYNAYTSLFQLKRSDILRIYKLENYYSDSEINEAKNSPVFVHYTPNMTTRPWIKHCTHPLKDKYWEYRLMIEGGHKVLESDNRSIKMRILGAIYRKSPNIYYNLINSFGHVKSHHDS